MLLAKKSAAQKIKTEIVIRRGFFFPKYTAASAIQPRPLEMPGTKEETLMHKKAPERDAKSAAKAHA